MRPPSPCRPYPTSPKDACRAGRRTGEAASAAGQYPQCPGSIGPSGAAIVLPGLRRWTSPYPQCPRRTHLEPAAQLRRRLQRWGDTAVPGVGEAIRGRDRIWECAGVEAPPPPGHTRSAPEGCAWGRLWCRATAATWVRCLHNAAERGPIRGRDRIGQAPTVGHPTTRVIPAVPRMKDAPWNADQLGGRDGGGDACAGMAFAVAGSAIYERPGPFHTLDAPGLLGRPVGARTGAGAADDPR